jgi:hypothetical protein
MVYMYGKNNINAGHRITVQSLGSIPQCDWCSVELNVICVMRLVDSTQKHISYQIHHMDRH